MFLHWSLYFPSRLPTRFYRPVLTLRSNCCKNITASGHHFQFLISSSMAHRALPGLALLTSPASPPPICPSPQWPLSGPTTGDPLLMGFCKHSSFFLDDMGNTSLSRESPRQKSQAEISHSGRVFVIHYTVFFCSCHTGTSLRRNSVCSIDDCILNSSEVLAHGECSVQCGMNEAAMCLERDGCLHMGKGLEV